MADINFRRAAEPDLPTIVALLADDPLGRQRERSAATSANFGQSGATLARSYRDAFAAIESDPNQLLAVATDGARIVGTLQLSFIPGLSRNGTWRGQIEAVRIATDSRGSGLGRLMFTWAIAECRARGCHLVQLTSDRQRPDAHRFYEQLGFVASHVGYKLAITRTEQD